MKYLISIFLLLFTASYSQYLCPWNTFSSGAGVTIGVNYGVGATINQTAIGTITSTNFIIHSGFWQLGLTPAIAEDKETEIINTDQLLTKLFSAKPNPFRTQTSIRYSLAAKEKVILEIFDASGRIVKTLVNREIQPGIYNIYWDGTNNRNQKLSAGVFFYKLQTDNYKATKKILLIQ